LFQLPDQIHNALHPGLGETSLLWCMHFDFFFKDATIFNSWL
jgi:hypothetical protein